jgi:hypothetical protein
MAVAVRQVILMAGRGYQEAQAAAETGVILRPAMEAQETRLQHPHHKAITVAQEPWQAWEVPQATEAAVVVAQAP